MGRVAELEHLHGIDPPPNPDRQRRRYNDRDFDRMADELAVLVRQCGGNMPGDADVSAALGVPRGTFSVWKNDHNHPVGRRYNDILSAIARAHPIEPASHARSKWIEGMRIAQESDDYDD